MHRHKKLTFCYAFYHADHRVNLSPFRGNAYGLTVLDAQAFSVDRIDLTGNIQVATG
jgi:hypothetical protein